MKVTGIVAEYNPFHKGHAYHIEQTKKITGADTVIVVMSGDFTQRGFPAFADKYCRAEMALMNGADLVLELPSCYACGSAEYFADGAVALLDSLGIVDSISFGTECGDIEKLRPIAEFLADEPLAFKEVLRREIKNGSTYPQARNAALAHCIPDFTEHQQIIGSPNNILGIEYIKSIIRRKSNMIPYTIQRTGDDYHSHRLHVNSFSSSIALRQSVDMQGSLNMIRDQLPESAYDILQKQFGKYYPIFSRDLFPALKYKLLSEEFQGYSAYVDINDDLSDRILNCLHSSYSFDQLCDAIKSKNVTYARVSRMLCHILLNQRKDDLAAYLIHGTVFYAHVLGFRKDAQDVLGSIAKQSSIPLVTKVSDWSKMDSAPAKRQFECDVLAANIYESIAADKYGTKMRNEYERQIVKV